MVVSPQWFYDHKEHILAMFMLVLSQIKEVIHLASLAECQRIH